MKYQIQCRILPGGFYEPCDWVLAGPEFMCTYDTELKAKVSMKINLKLAGPQGISPQHEFRIVPLTDEEYEARIKL